MTGFQLFSQTAPGLSTGVIIIICAVGLIAWVVGGLMFDDLIGGMVTGFFSAFACALLFLIPQTFKQDDLNEESNKVNIATFEDFYGVTLEKSMTATDDEIPSFNSLWQGQVSEPFKVKSASGETFEVVVKVVENEGFAYLFDGKLTPLEPASKEVVLK